jgi:hypothetical protein
LVVSFIHHHHNIVGDISFQGRGSTVPDPVIDSGKYLSVCHKNNDTHPQKEPDCSWQLVPGYRAFDWGDAHMGRVTQEPFEAFSKK